MKAWFVTRFGAPSVLRLRDIPVPAPGDEDVLVDVYCIGVNFADVFARLGVYPGIPRPPFVPGIEFSGVVRTTGRSVRGLKRGDRVMGFSRQGSYAECVCVPARHVSKVPARLGFAEAAAFPVAFLSAYHGLVTLAHISKGERVLIHAAAGGVGLAAIQIARHLGAEIFGTVGSQEKIEAAQREGAHHVINYRVQDFAEAVRVRTGGEGIDVILDSVGGSVFRKGWNLLAPMGRYVLYGFAAVSGEGGLRRLKLIKEAVQVPLMYPPSLVSRNVSLMGFNLYFLAHKHEYLQRAVRELLRWRERRIIKPRIGARFPFDAVPDVHAFLQSRKSIGKVIVEVRS